MPNIRMLAVRTAFIGVAVASVFAAFAGTASAAHNEHVWTYNTKGECEKMARERNNQVPSDGKFYYCSARQAGGWNLWRRVP